jgi:Holliday junction DNA helicase RuvA
MIGWLRGRIAFEEPSGVVLETNGVGYEVTLPAGTIARAQKDGTGAIELWIHTHVRQDVLELFGFASELERRVFRLLIGVPNVGPKTATGVLGALSIEELASSIAQRDLARLAKVPGIGKKTAERLVVELTDKLPAHEAAGKLDPSARPRKSGTAELLMKALINMGYRPAEAERAVAHLGKRLETEQMSELLRSALAFLTA